MTALATKFAPTAAAAVLALAAPPAALAQTTGDVGAGGPSLKEMSLDRSLPNAAPPATAGACNFGPHLVLFPFASAELTPETRHTLDAALSGYRNCGGSGVLLTGHTDRAGSPRYNLALADRRIKAVAAYLVAGGMPAQALSGEAHGESKPRVPTADGMREAQNRRVEITARAAAGI